MMHFLFSHVTAGIVVWVITLLIVIASIYEDEQGLKPSQLRGGAWGVVLAAVAFGGLLIWWW